jgi:hypothetical protein
MGIRKNTRSDRQPIIIFDTYNLHLVNRKKKKQKKFTNTNFISFY